MALSFKEWPTSIWSNFRVVRNEECESCGSYLWDVVVTASAGHFTLAKVESPEIGELLVSALQGLKNNAK